MMKTRFFILLAAILLVSGCAQDINPDDYEVESVGAVSKAEPGEIVSARDVFVEGNTQGGELAGLAAGSVAGSELGQGTRANALGAIGGAIIGDIVGKEIEAKASSQKGIEYVIRKDNGEMVTLTQGTEPAFSPGDRVLILYDSKRARIIADNEKKRAP
ncbi:MAG: hypothetical protein LBM56_00430 [Burkholderiaceae bacterium]|nr:hypothetical protein [Burkholderiaceae bacterium]